jgi:hypothetical protein
VGFLGQRNFCYSFGLILGFLETLITASWSHEPTVIMNYLYWFAIGGDMVIIVHISLPIYHHQGPKMVVMGASKPAVLTFL